jgi:hypothetical protein
MLNFRKLFSTQCLFCNEHSLGNENSSVTTHWHTLININLKMHQYFYPCLSALIHISLCVCFLASADSRFSGLQHSIMELGAIWLPFFGPSFAQSIDGRLTHAILKKTETWYGANPLKYFLEGKYALSSMCRNIATLHI